jgi:hypothetical protein
MPKARILALALCCGALVWSDASQAEGALAVGMPNGDPSNGLRWSLFVNNSDAANEALKDCRESKYPESAAACIVVNTFSDQCAAIAVNGGPNDPVSAAGWAFGPDKATATSRAIAQCDAMGRRKGNSSPCQLDGERAVLCDGSAK